MIVTALIQSSSSLSIMLIGFINASLLPLENAIWTMMGALLREAKKEVIQVPIFWPNTTNAATLNSIKPFSANDCNIPIEADELWIKAVKIAPFIVLPFDKYIIKMIDKIYK